MTKFSTTVMWTINIFILILFGDYTSSTNNTEDDPGLYYYGIEESEHGLPACGARQACAALLRRYWRRDALLRLCRCQRRRRCDSPAPPDRRVDINNRAYFQFCQPTDDWPRCAFGATSLVVPAAYDSMDADELEEMHHQNVQMAPPKIIFNCKCPEPNYWKIKPATDDDSIRRYQCRALSLCSTNEFCGNVDFNAYALYQSCLCPKRHICVHNGGTTYHDISELLYRGKGWRAYCQKVNDDYDYEED